MKKPIQRRLLISNDVKEAFFNKKGVVALESTLITHGLPYPDNFKTALALEETIKQHDCTPATIAVINGIIRVGLNIEELEQLAQDQNALKLSRRDMPYALSQKKNGGTTVATTMMIAEQANIRIFATGGIGGVHRGVGETFDISADLEELGRCNVCVVCAGAKAILDIPKTLEVLETKGVPTISFGCDDFPAFYYRNSGVKGAYRLDHVEEITDLLIQKWNMAGWPDGLHFNGGVLIGNPIDPAFEYPKKDVERCIKQALAKMTLSGRDVTPYLLARLADLSQGKSKTSNIALLKNNAALAAKIAHTLSAKLG